jgi:hypothetical protein
MSIERKISLKQMGMIDAFLKEKNITVKFALDKRSDTIYSVSSVNEDPLVIMFDPCERRLNCGDKAVAAIEGAGIMNFHKTGLI